MKRRDFLKSVTGVAAGALVPAPAILSAAKADARSETLLIVSEGGPNNLDIHGVGTNVPGYEVSWNCYDRLITHEMKSGPGGVPYYDRDKFKPELADDMKIDDMSVTFKLKKNAKFHDGAPVTAKDVKWSLDRAVCVGGFPTFQMSAGSLTKPEQFVIVDDNTVRVDFAKKDRLTIPDLAVIVPCVVNSELVKKNATEKDPWGLEYTKQQTAGSGAYKVTKWTAGTEVIMERNDDVGRRSHAEDQARDLAHGAAGRQPPRAAGARRRRHLLRIAVQGFPGAEGRRQAQHRVAAVLQRHPVYRHERHQAAVRQSEGAPGDRLRDSLSEDHGRRCCSALPIRCSARPPTSRPKWRGRSRPNTSPTWPRRRRCSPRPAIPNGFETTISFDLNFAGVNEPLCVLVQESLGQIGIKTTINKIPGANWRTELNKKEMPLYTNVFSGWLDYPEYFFYWCYHGNNSVFNTMSYKSPEMDKLIDGARNAASTGDKATYDTDVKGFVDLAFKDIPRIPLYQPFVNVAMQKNISGYQYWFHRRLDYRALVKA